MKKRILSILAIGLIVASVHAAKVATIDDKGNKNPKIEKANVERGDASVKYVGETTDNGIVFDVNYENPTGQRFVLAISNSQGDIIFYQNYKGFGFHKTVVIKNDAETVGTVSFSVKSNSDEIFSKTFQIDTESKVVRNVVVKSVN